MIDLSQVRTKPAEEDPLASWTPADRAWLATLPPVLQQVARRHGRRLYLLIVCGDAFNDGAQRLMALARGNREAEELIAACAGAMAALVGEVEASIVRLTQEGFNEARTDISRAIALLGSVSPGGLAGRQ